MKFAERDTKKAYRYQQKKINKKRHIDLYTPMEFI